MNTLRLAPGTFALVGLTQNILKKKIFNATKPVRDYLTSVDYHRFEEQGMKATKEAVLVTARGLRKSRVTLYSPPSKTEPRMWVSNLQRIAGANDVVILTVRNGLMHTFNLSNLSIERLDDVLSQSNPRGAKSRQFALQNDGKDLPDLDMVATEGTQKLRQHLFRERSPRIVKAKRDAFELQHGRLFCEACGFDFELSYGSSGAGYMECHHVVPLSSRKAAEETRLGDLVLLCSNCHRIVHRKKVPLTMEQLRACIRASR